MLSLCISIRSDTVRLLRRHGTEACIAVWGVVPGKNNSNVTKFRRAATLLSPSLTQLVRPTSSPRQTSIGDSTVNLVTRSRCAGHITTTVSRPGRRVFCRTHHTREWGTVADTDTEYTFTDTDGMLAALEHHVEAMWPAKATYEREAAIVQSFLSALGANPETVAAILAGDQVLYHDWHRSRSNAIED